PTLRGALKAVDAGVDGLVVEGGEGGGFKNPRDVASMVLLPLVRSKVDVPIIAAGGIMDGPTMAAAFVPGAAGAQRGSRRVPSAGPWPTSSLTRWPGSTNRCRACRLRMAADVAAAAEGRQHPDHEPEAAGREHE